MESVSKFGKLNIICDNLEGNPFCPHGPSLLYERIQSNGKMQKYFACSAYKTRKMCTFFVPYGNTLSEEKKLLWVQENKKFVQKENAKINQRLENIKVLKPNERGYCHTCNCAFYNKGSHEAHVVTKPLSDYLLNHPSQLLHLKTSSKGESQFIFSNKTVDVIIGGLKELNIDKVLCVGTPSIHEKIRDNVSGVSSLLLDFDNRYKQFYDKTEFLWFNMMNFYYFDESKGSKTVKDFLSTGNVVLVMDPPFSAREEPLAYTLSKFNSIYQQFHRETILPVVWIFPYFKEGEVINSWPNMKMLDYNVTYINQKRFKEHTGDKATVVRIFTNLDASKFKFPIEEGYHFCIECNRWVSQFNIHCYQCGKCPSKNGHPYKHCNICLRCVKNYWQHCEKCQRCALQEHPCDKWQISEKQLGKKRKLQAKNEQVVNNMHYSARKQIKVRKVQHKDEQETNRKQSLSKLISSKRKRKKKLKQK